MPEQLPSFRTELQELLLVAVGAVPGALMRWQFGVVLHDKDVLVNVLGALILGLLLGLPYRPRIQLLVGIGFCGSLTTFSSWMVNSVDLIASGKLFEAIGLIGITLGLGLGGAALGLWIGRRVDALAIKPSERPR
tara:strand:+ start:318 stop:722 length:405 start_codon:yes stop_codon:yes gene_type:complete